MNYVFCSISSTYCLSTGTAAAEETDFAELAQDVRKKGDITAEASIKNNKKLFENNSFVLFFNIIFFIVWNYKRIIRICLTVFNVRMPCSWNGLFRTVKVLF